MNLFLTLAFLFFIGSLSGWFLEVLFRRFLSETNPEKKWINPGFCTGPYLPLYGCGLCLIYLIASFENLNFINDPFWEKALLFAAMAICMTELAFKQLGFFVCYWTFLRYIYYGCRFINTACFKIEEIC